MHRFSVRKHFYLPPNGSENSEIFLCLVKRSFLSLLRTPANSDIFRYRKRYRWPLSALRNSREMKIILECLSFLLDCKICWENNEDKSQPDPQKLAEN